MWCICVKENYQSPYKLPLPSHRTPECTIGGITCQMNPLPLLPLRLHLYREENMETLSFAPWLSLGMRCENLLGVSL